MRERWIAVGVAVAGALLVIAGAFSDSWLVSGDLDYPSAAGLWSVERCDPGGCDRADHPSTFGAIAAVCFWIGMAAAATLLVAAAIAARGRRITRAISPEGTAIVASLAALAAAIAALVSQPYATLQLGTGPGFLIFSVGAALGLLGGMPRDAATAGVSSAGGRSWRVPSPTSLQRASRRSRSRAWAASEPSLRI